MATGVKAAAFAALVRVLVEVFPARHRTCGNRWSPRSPSLSMVVGNLVALTQRSLKRMLAYSSIGARRIPARRRLAGQPGRGGRGLLYLLAYA